MDELNVAVPAPNEAVGGAAQATILVIEDDSLDFLIMREVLRPEGYHVLHEVDLAAAETRLTRDKIDLIVSDLLLPSGWPDASLRQLQELAIRLPVIVVSCWSDQLAVHAMQGGSRLRLFDKTNFNPGDFLALVRQLLAVDPADEVNPFHINPRNVRRAAG